MSKRILVTGGFGYIGGRVCQYLSTQSSNQILIGTRDIQQPKPDWLKNGELVKLELSDQESMYKACIGVDSIIHLASMNEIECARDPERAVTINSLGSVKLLQAAIKAGVGRLLFFSTAHVYGSPLSGTLTEESLPRPQHPYAITHKTAEDFILAAHDKRELNAVILRLSNGFGCPERKNVNRWTLLVNDLCRQAVTSGKLVLHSSGKQIRDFITLTDVARTVEHVLNMSDKTISDGLFNLGGENSKKIIDIAKIISERCSVILNKKILVEHLNENNDDFSYQLNYSIDKLKSTGFTLKSNHIEEIDNTIKFCHDSFKMCS